ncbi:hypothetical protein MCAP1_000851 [Malassezia caprae]|uniref:Uncharacterized protein n=1 Tax=Malassezia caprae TaxID=1381934 RepID=A0AAF0E4V8_9BASI|nr:hypothetical protein MCAP1_000851 [Malassezia caprae]
MGATSGTGRSIALLAFMLLGASFVLQLINSLSVPIIHGLSFLDFDLTSQGSRGAFHFGIWGWCSQQTGHSMACRRTGPGDYDAFLGSLEKTLSLRSVPYNDPFLGHLSQALVLQPISAGFTGLAAGAALLSVCINSFLWVLAAVWAAILSIATLVIELVLFLNGKSKFSETFDEVAAFDTVSVTLGKGNWIQVAATAAAVVGAVVALVAFITNHTHAGDAPHTPAAPLPMTTAPTYAPRMPTPLPPPAPAPHEPVYVTPHAAYDSAAQAPLIDSTGMGRAYDTDAPYEDAAAPMLNRYSQLYNEREAGSRPGERVRSSQEKRASRRRSDGHRHRSQDYMDARPRRSFEYDYDYDAYPPRRMEYGSSSHVRHRSTTTHYGRDRNRKYAERGSHLYPDEVYDAEPTPNDEARWRRLSQHLSY